MELMVAMAITTIIVTVLVSITSIALDTRNRSRAELRASRQAKSMMDTMARDFEAMVSRRGNTNQWLTAKTASETVGENLESTNSAELIFFTAVTDRYNGEIAVAGTDLGGDVSCVAYRLGYRDPINPTNVGFETFVLNRLLVNPNETFTDLLGKPDLNSAFSTYLTKVENPENFVCENVFQFSVTFHVEVNKVVGTTMTVVNVPVTIGKTSSNTVTQEFKISGNGLETDLVGGTVTADEMRSGRIKGVEIAMTVISDFGIDQLRRRTFTDAQKAEFMAQNSYEYAKYVQIPGM